MSRADTGRANRLQWTLAAMAPFVSLLVIRPWTPSAFPVWDYDDMLPLLRGTRSFWAAFVALSHLTRMDGRANYLTYLQLAATWRLAGDNPVLWQWSRALLMVLAGCLFVIVVRRLGGTALAATLGGLVVTIAVPATEGWLFIMGEPLALILLLALVLAGAGFVTTPAWRTRAVIIAVLAGLVMLSKEVLALCLPPVILFAVCWNPESGFHRPRLSRRERWLAALLAVVVALESWSMLRALHAAVPGAYAASFGRRGLDGRMLVVLVQAMTLPDRFTSASVTTDLYPANIAFLAIIVFGLASWTSRPSSRRDATWIAGLLSFPVIGAFTYALWPRYSAFYGIPFFAGSAGLLAAAASELDRHQRTGRVMVAVIGTVIVAYTALVSMQTVAYQRAIADVAASIVRVLPHQPRLDTLFVVSPRVGGRQWPITGNELERYARAIRVPETSIPTMVDASCEVVAGRLREPLGHSGVLNDRNPCGRLPAATVTWRTPVLHRDWQTFRTTADTLTVELLAPAWASHP